MDSAVFTTVVVVVVVVMVVVVRVAVLVPTEDRSLEEPSCRLFMSRLFRFSLFWLLTQIISVETEEHSFP